MFSLPEKIGSVVRLKSTDIATCTVTFIMPTQTPDENSQEECKNSGDLITMVHSSKSSFLQSMSDFAHGGPN